MACIGLFGTCMLGLLPVWGAAEGADGSAYRQLLEKASPALVTVKFVLKRQGTGGTQEREGEITGVMIDPKGLVLCASWNLGTSRIMRRFGGTTTPTDIKILIGDDTEGVEARMLATDAELDLSWLQIKEPAEAGYAYLDFSKPSNLAPGNRLLTLSRMNKFFDRAPVVAEGRLGGTTRKPRPLLLPSGGFEVEPGMPVFSSDGAPVGLVVVQSPDPEDLAADPRTLRNSMAALILPSSEVLKATARAKAAGQSDEEDEEDDEGSPPATTAPATQAAKPSR